MEAAKRSVDVALRVSLPDLEGLSDMVEDDQPLARLRRESVDAPVRPDERAQDAVAIGAAVGWPVPGQLRHERLLLTSRR